MKLLATLRPFVSALFRRARIESEMDEEMRAHIQSRAEDLVRSGLGRAEAERRALIEFGCVERFKEECRDALGTRFLETLLQDIRFGLRMLRKSPGFALVVIVTLALGIGANTTVFSAVNGILIEPLPYAHSNRLIEIEGREHTPGGGIQTGGPGLPELRDIRVHCPAIGQIAYAVGAQSGYMLGGSFPDMVEAQAVSGNFFTMLGVRPLLGRAILPPDVRLGNDQVAVLSYRLWEADFGADANVVGREITLGKKPYTVIGVMPSDFHPLMGYSAEVRGLWVSLVPPPGATSDRGEYWYRVIARLRPSATLAAANVQLKNLSALLAAAYPATEKGWELSARSMKDVALSVPTGVRRGATLPVELLILLAAVGAVILIACVNVSGMLLARSWSRHREVAIRAALGATRRRIVSQFLLESLLLSLAGGALGLLLAVWLIPALHAIAPAGTPRIDRIQLDLNVLWFTLGISLFSGILFGLAPALQVSGSKIGASLKDGFGGLLEGSPGRGAPRLRSALIVAEIALAVILAAGAGLMARSLQKMMAVPMGFRTEHVLTVTANLGGSACKPEHPEPCYVAAGEILDRLRSLPGVEAATTAATTPLFGGYGTSVRIRGRGLPDPRTPGAAFDVVMPGYFRAMGIPLLAGRDFAGSDTRTSARVAIVNRAFARLFFPGANPLGQRMSKWSPWWGKDHLPQWMEIIGVVGDIRQDRITSPPDPEFYMTGTQSPELALSPWFLVRTAAGPLALAGAIRQQIMSVDRDAPIMFLQTINQIIAKQEAGPRFRALLLGAFGVLGVLLAIVGIYGVMSYVVSRRTREIGLRMALGARPGDALRMVIGEGMVLAAVGIMIGVGGALALTRLLRSFLFEIKPTDPATFLGVAVALALAALLACYVPARRAMRVDPMTALRNE